MKPDQGIGMTLKALQVLEVAAFRQIADYWNRSPKLAQTYVNRCCALGYVERINHGSNPAKFRLTENGRDVLESKNRTKGVSMQAMEGEGIIAHAKRTQPSSVWDLCKA